MGRPNAVKLLALMVLLGVLLQHVYVNAQGSSTNFRIDESFIGPGGVLDSESTNYNFQSGQQSVGNIGVVEGTSTNYRTQGGYTTTDEPRLRCVLNTASLNFNALSTAVAATANATFSVLNYTSYGYNVTLVGNTPSNSGYNLINLGSNAASSPGTEQFGVNLVRNTDFFAPGSHLGADPVQVPDSSFSSGAAATNYNTSGSFRYNSGETVASAGQSSGQTDYNISYIINVSTTTPGGVYSGNQIIVCTGTY